MSRAGINQIVLCDKGTLDTTPANPLAMGLRGEAAFTAEPHKQVETYLGQKLRNMMNVKFESDTFQITMQMLKSLIGWSGNNVDAQIITTPQSASAGSEDVFKLSGDDAFGLDFELEVSNEKRAAKITLERAFEYDRFKTWLDAADSNTAVDFGLSNARGIDYTLYHAPYFLSFSVNGNDFVQVPDIISRKLTIKTENKKDANNVSIVDWLDIELEIKTRSASISEIMNQLGNPMSPVVLMKEKNAGSYYDAFDFASGVLVQEDKIQLDDKERSRTAIFRGKVAPYDCSFLFGTGNGGDAADTKGTTGGTIKIGY